MKILYGVQGTGNGHISRSRELVAGLKARGHDVHVIFSGRDPGLLAETASFEPFTAFHGLAYVTNRGRIDYLATARTLNFPRFVREIASFDASGFDLAVTDFEPITSRVARRHGIPSIAIGHQYAMLHDVPLAKGNPLARAVLEHFAPADTVIGLHWHHFEQPILPPVLPPHLVRGQSVERKILVYLPFEHRSDIAPVLRRIPLYDFYVYGLGSDNTDADHVHWRGYSRNGFLADLRDCDGVICSAGFELPSEALFLGKRLLVKPVEGQMEQESNALALQELGLGSATAQLTGRAIRNWLETSEHREPIDYPDVAAHIVDWLGAGKWNDASQLVRATWKNVAPVAEFAKAGTSDRRAAA